MNRYLRLLTVVFLQIVLFGEVMAQVTEVQGKVTDATSGEPLPFAIISFKGSSVSTSTDFDGYYHLYDNKAHDSLVVDLMGYESKSYPLRKGKQDLNIKMGESSIMIDEMVISKGEDPVYVLMRRVLEAKEKHNHKELEAYKYNAYTKIEVDINNMEDKFMERKMMQEFFEAVDSSDMIYDKDGEMLVPLFISETVSEYHFRNNPKLTKEYVQATKIAGVAIEDGSVTSQVVGSSFQQYNFYENWLNILDKDFISPIANGWKTSYKLFLADSLMIDGDYCYEVHVDPIRASDLAFKGKMWITKEEAALKRIDVTVDKQTNLNFIDEIEIYQELAPLNDTTVWMPNYTKVVVDVGKVSGRLPGVLGTYQVTNSNIQLTEPKPAKFYEYPIEVLEDAQMKDEAFWKAQEGEMTPNEKKAVGLIDTLKQLPTVKSYLDIIDFLVNGYYEMPNEKWELGPIFFAYAWNELEGNRFRLGFRTRHEFSDKVQLYGYGAYGFRDNRWKYNAGAKFFLNRRPWTEMGIDYIKDVHQMGITGELGNNFFEATAHWGTLIVPFMKEQTSVYLQRQLNRDFSEKITIRNYFFESLFDFDYYQDSETGATLSNNFTATEVEFETRFGFKEVFIQNGNSRISLGAKKWPVVTLKYTLGLSKLLASDFQYNKLETSFQQDIKLGLIGWSRYNITGGYIFEDLPAPLLELHLGNSSFFYNYRTFNLMNPYEFVSDTYASLAYVHHFDGFILNRIPLMKKLKWRLVANYTVLYGSLRDANRKAIPGDIEGLYALNDEPYMDVGYGIENIFKLIRVEVFHRLTQLDNPNVSKFGVKGTIQFYL